VFDTERASRGLWNYATKNATAEFKGVKPLLFHVHDGSLVHTTKKAVKVLEDFKGLKIRAPNRQASRMIDALGAAPVQMPLPQAAEALSKGVIDGAMIPWEVVPAMKFEEVTKFHTEMPAGSAQISNTVFVFAMNQARYDSLPPELKKVIDANSGAERSAWVGKVFVEDSVPGRKTAEARNNNFYTLPAAELKRWEAATSRVADEWVTDLNAKGFNGKQHGKQQSLVLTPISRLRRKTKALDAYHYWLKTTNGVGVLITLQPNNNLLKLWEHLLVRMPIHRKEIKSLK
jgi:TRAP-type C4-dicarboxylate transport system substrate-binding protein